MSGSTLSLRRRLFYSHLICAIVIASAVASYMYWAIYSDVVQVSQLHMRAAANEVSIGISALELSAGGDGRTKPTDASLVDVLDTAGSLHQLRSATLLVNGKQLGTRKSVEPSDNGSGNDDDLVFQAAIASANADTQYLLTLHADGSAQQSHLREIRNYALLGFIGAVLLSLIFAKMLAQRMETALDVMVERLQQVAAGRFDARIKNNDDDAFGRLGNAFNEMSERLQRTLGERERTLTQLRDARTQLEGSIRDRTKELVELNVLLRGEHEQRAQMEASLAEAAATDPLTRLLNRRAMLGLMQHVGAAMRKNGKKCCFAILDIDHFKQVNDRFGHAVGDQVLSTVSDVIRTHLRADEAAARWGGEEFLLAWPDQNLAVAEQRADRLRELIGDCSFENGSLRITASFGVAEWGAAEDLEMALKRSDKALYCAKAEGRNRVRVQNG
jgi:diguanylate cyclase (GGDEF)-like protein